MKTWMVCMAVAVLGLTGCGDSDEEICDDMAENFEEFAEKAEPCADSTGGDGEYDKAQCVEGLSTCSEEDKESVREFAECLAGVDKCDPNNQEDFENAIAFCAIGKLLGVSEECGSAAVGGIE